MIFCKTSVLNPYKREVLSAHKYERLIDFLQDEYPEGFSVPTDVHIGSDKVDVDDYDMVLNEDDIVILLERPALPATFFGGSALIAWLANTAISFALSYVVNRIFTPEAPDQTTQQQNQASTVYNLNNSQNLAKLGGVVPVVYGTVRMYPSMITQPYFRYADNDEYLYHLLCVGHGKYSIDKFLIDSQDMTGSEDVEYQLVTQDNFNDIEGFIGDANYSQLVNTLSTPSNLRIPGYYLNNVSTFFGATDKIKFARAVDIQAGSTLYIRNSNLNDGEYTVESSYIDAGDTRVTTVEKTIVTESTNPVNANALIETELYPLSSGLEYVEVDFIYPSGLYELGDDGDFENFTDVVRIYFRNTSGTRVHYEYISTTGGGATPLRFTVRLPYYADYNTISFYRSYGESTSQKIHNPLVVARIKEIYPQPNLTDVGDISLLWVKIKASNAISSLGQTQVNGFFTRTDKPNDIRSVLEDIYTNTNYGGRLPLEDLDFIDTSETVNGAFDTQSTIFDALKLISKSQKYTVYPVGQELLLKYDDVNNISSGLYNETNIIKDSLKVQYAFKEENASSDSVECTYRNGDDWNAEKVQYPTDGLYPATIELFGVTETAQAESMAKYLYKQEQARIKIVTFDTDIQGLVPQFLDKILISHSSMLWGTAGEVYEVTGTTIELSDPVLGWVDTTAVTVLATYATGSYNITFRKIDGSVSDTLPYTIISEYVIDVPSLPSWVKDGTFYTNGEPKEYLVTKITPKGEKVSIECVNYDAGVYT